MTEHAPIDLITPPSTPIPYGEMSGDDDSTEMQVTTKTRISAWKPTMMDYTYFLAPNTKDGFGSYRVPSNNCTAAVAVRVAQEALDANDEKLFHEALEYLLTFDDDECHHNPYFMMMSPTFRANKKAEQAWEELPCGSLFFADASCVISLVW